MTENTTALYIRLSQEDDNIGESNSVINQRDLLNDFVAKHPDLSKTKLLYFIDDGHSGTNFNRPNVTALLEQVRKGKIQNIVVKDFSRFGRNYIEVGGYLEQVFPFLGVRFLSVNDFFDSNDHKGKSAGLEVGFKTLLHDLYSKDLGIKTTTGKIAKTKKGEHIGGTAPYGYVKSKTIKNAWDIDEAAAVIIRKIYDLALEGHTPTEIGRILNAEGVPTPLSHRKNNGTVHQVINNSISETNVWKREAVTRILRDERFTGKIVSGKMKKVAYGNVKRKLLSQSEWLIVPNAHEPIISQEIFNKVQSILGPINQRTLNRVNSNIFTRKLYCGHCGHGLRRYTKPNLKSEYAPRYVCRSSIEIGKERCLPEPILESYISEVVMEALRLEIALAHTAKQKAEKHGDLLLRKHEKLAKDMKRLSSEFERLKNNRERLFEDYADGKLSKEQYMEAKAEQSVFIAKAESDIACIAVEMEEVKPSVQNDTSYDILVPYADAKEVTHEVMALIKRMNVYADNRFEIEFAFERLS